MPFSIDISNLGLPYHGYVSGLSSVYDTEIHASKSGLTFENVHVEMYLVAEDSINAGRRTWSAAPKTSGSSTPAKSCSSTFPVSEAVLLSWVMTFQITSLILNCLPTRLALSRRRSLDAQPSTQTLVDYALVFEAAGPWT